MNGYILKLAFPKLIAIKGVVMVGKEPVETIQPQLEPPEIYQDGDDLVMMTYDLRTEKFVVQIDDDPEIEVVI